MPIFARRQLQTMLNELEPWLTRPKAVDLIKRLDNRDADQALPAEYELAISWGISKFASLKLEQQSGRRLPDLFSSDLVPRRPILADVAAMSDDALSGEPLMRRAANIINGTCQRFRKGASGHLYFEFGQEMGYRPSNVKGGRAQFYRRRRVDARFAMTEPLERALKNWLGVPIPSASIRWADEFVDVTISWKDQVHPHANAFSAMPSITYDLHDNPLVTVLKSKARQLRGAEEGVGRAIFLGDAGCTLLRDVERRADLHSVRGAEIIRTFLSTSTVDLVVVLVPRRQNEYTTHNFNNPRRWLGYVYGKDPELTAEAERRVGRLCQILPDPHLHGYQARSWHQQGMCDPQAHGHYLPSQFTSGAVRMTARISARGLQELLAGRLSSEQFQHWIVGKHNIFEAQLKRGMTISNVTLEKNADGSDDDLLLIEFSPDPAASALRNPMVDREGVDRPA